MEGTFDILCQSEDMADFRYLHGKLEPRSKGTGEESWRIEA